MMKAYNKYAKVGAVAPDHVQAAAAAVQSGSVTAAPEQYDQAYLSPVSVGGKTLQLDFDTGSADRTSTAFIDTQERLLTFLQSGCSPRLCQAANSPVTLSTTQAPLAGSYLDRRGTLATVMAPAQVVPSTPIRWSLAV